MSHETTWKKLEDNMLSKISQLQKEKYSIYVVYKVVKFIEKQVVASSGWGRENSGCGLYRVLLCKMERFWKIYCITMRIYLTLLNSSVKTGYIVDFI